MLPSSHAAFSGPEQQREQPYEVPGVSTRPIIDGNQDYLARIAKETDTASEQMHGPAS